MHKGVNGWLHDHTLAASGVFILTVHLHLVVGTGAAGVCASVTGHVLVVLPDFADDIVESIVDIDAILGGCLDEVATERGG